jgi:hypothetical protein
MFDRSRECMGGLPLIDRFGQPLGGRTAAAFLELRPSGNSRANRDAASARQGQWWLRTGPRGHHGNITRGKARL